jgi:membrane protease YdiL (CAAX protease family)
MVTGGWPAAVLALPAVAVWFVLARISPLAPPLSGDLPDPVTLAVGSLITLVTASVLEEVFYRRWLQTRLEARLGRWPGVLIAALLFAGMHSYRLEDDSVALGLCTIVAVQGVLGLLLGYLWSRYRNIWIPITIHTLTNLVYVDLLRDHFIG